MRDYLTVWYAALDPRTPWYAKAAVVLVTTYLFNPIDLVPDSVPILGYLNDLVLIPAGIALKLNLIPSEVMEGTGIKAVKQGKNGQLVCWRTDRPDMSDDSILHHSRGSTEFYRI